jgi:hypothetical protein
MSTFKERLAIAAALLAMVGQPGWAQQSAAPAATTDAAPAGRFDALAAADQKIARALFLAQQVTAAGPAPLSLDQVAALRDGASWSKVLKDMRSRGLVEAKNLDEVIDAEARAPGKVGGAKGKLVTVTRGSGNSTAIGSITARDAEEHDRPPLRSP